MMGSWRLPALAIAGLFGAVAFLCPACGGAGAENPAPISDASTTAADEVTVETVEFDVDGMTCGGCAAATEIALERLDGVRSADASYHDDSGAGRAVVEYDPTRVSPERMIDAVEAIGFHPTLRQPLTGGG
jgi:copper chaperone